MSFHSLSFIFIFFPIVFLIYYCLPKSYQKVYMIAVSLLFYAWNEPIYIFGLIVLILLNYRWAIALDQKSSDLRKKQFYWICFVNVFIFFYFKYYDFLLQTLFQFFNFSLTYEVYKAPLGISFFMFSIIGYQIDVYRRVHPAEKDFIDYCLFVSFFPKLTMGPIVSYTNWKNQKVSMSFQKINKGAIRFIIGLAEKVILAKEMENLFQFASLQQLDFINAWVMTLAFAFQLYFDFHGYTHMALGLAEMFGYELLENFDYPYLSPSVSSFWRRWHITLGRWFRDYIYIPLGGNRVSKAKWIRNTMIVWMLTGLWHGAEWSFVVWGLYHGVVIILEKLIFKEPLKKLPLPLQIFLTFMIVNIGWVFFYSQNLSQALHILYTMVQIRTFSFFEFRYYFHEYGFIMLICMIASTPILKNIRRQLNAFQWIHVLEIVVIFIIFLLSIAFIIGSSYQSFLYSAF